MVPRQALEEVGAVVVVALVAQVADGLKALARKGVIFGTSLRCV